MLTLKSAEVTQNETIKIKVPVFDSEHFSANTAYYYNQNGIKVKWVVPKK